MFTSPPSAETSDPAEAAIDLTAQAAADAQFYRGVLHRMIDLGVNLVQSAHDQVQAAAASGEAAPHATAAFERFSRAVRRAIALARHVAQPLPAHAGQGAYHRTAARKQVIRAVEDAIECRANDDEHAGQLYAEFRERLDGPDLDADIANRPLADLILEIVRDLGVRTLPASHRGPSQLPSQMPPPGKRRTPQDLEALSALAAAAPGTPASELPYVPPPRARGDAFDHPDDLLDPKTMTDAQLDAAIEREDERDRLNSG